MGEVFLGGAGFTVAPMWKHNAELKHTIRTALLAGDIISRTQIEDGYVTLEEIENSGDWWKDDTHDLWYRIGSDVQRTWLKGLTSSLEARIEQATLRLVDLKAALEIAERRAAG